MQPKNPIFVAVDTPDVGRARALAEAVAGHVGGIKLGMEFCTANGPQGALQVLEGLDLPLFLDLKFHDIPNTVAGAIRAAVATLKPFLVNVHATGGTAMLKAAAEAGNGSNVIAVTVLTSLSADDLGQVGIMGPVERRAVALAELAQAQGCAGVVCAASEIGSIKAACGSNFLTVVPGIRPAGADAGDQKRVMTPRAALDLGADYLVIGRPITGADDPAAAAKAISQSLAAECRG
ncbi:MAG: orotidine-5'-phosphate decarboxylase [Alphaproteobacteria bacterium]